MSHQGVYSFGSGHFWYNQFYQNTRKIIYNPKSVNQLVKYTLEHIRTFFEFIKVVRNEILHVQCKIQKAVTPFYKLSGRFKSERSH